MLGITYLVAGSIRLVAMFLDRSVESSNVISTVVELGFGVSAHPLSGISRIGHGQFSSNASSKI